MFLTKCAIISYCYVICYSFTNSEDKIEGKIKREAQLSPRDPRDALYHLRCWWIMQTHCVSVWGALSATATFYSATCIYFRAALKLVRARVLCQMRAPYRPITRLPLPPIAGPQNCGPGCWDIARYWSKIADCNLPHLHLVPMLGIIPLEFRLAFCTSKHLLMGSCMALFAWCYV